MESGEADQEQEQLEIPEDSEIIDVRVSETPTEENYDNENEGVTILQLGGSVRGKYYKQTYRSAWEQMPDFKGWLRGVHGEPTRAYCTYCQKTLHAHRLSLLKHTCTIRHQKAAQMHNSRKNKIHIMNPQEVNIQTMMINSEEGLTQEDIENEGETTLVTYTEQEAAEMEDENPLDKIDDEDVEEEEEDDESVQFPMNRVHFQTQYRKIVPPMLKSDNMRAVCRTKPPLSTHVIDTTRGFPVSGLQVSLYKLIDGRWTYINEGVTDTEGKFSQFLERSDFTPGRYKLHYDVDRYFESRKVESLYPFIEIVMDCSITPSESYHVPLLLSPFGYSTYRGS